MQAEAHERSEGLADRGGAYAFGPFRLVERRREHTYLADFGLTRSTS